MWVREQNKPNTLVLFACHSSRTLIKRRKYCRLCKQKLVANRYYKQKDRHLHHHSIYHFVCVRQMCCKQSESRSNILSVIIRTNTILQIHASLHSEHKDRETSLTHTLIHSYTHTLLLEHTSHACFVVSAIRRNTQYTQNVYMILGSSKCAWATNSSLSMCDCVWPSSHSSKMKVSVNDILSSTLLLLICCCFFSQNVMRNLFLFFVQNKWFSFWKCEELVQSSNKWWYF